MVLAVSSHIQASCLIILLYRKPSTNSVFPSLLASRPWRMYHHFTHQSKVKEHLNFPQNLHKGNFGEGALLTYCLSHVVTFPEADLLWRYWTPIPAKENKGVILLMPAVTEHASPGMLSSVYTSHYAKLLVEETFFCRDAKISALVLRLSNKNRLKKKLAKSASLPC